MSRVRPPTRVGIKEALARSIAGASVVKLKLHHLRLRRYAFIVSFIRNLLINLNCNDAAKKMTIISPVLILSPSGALPLSDCANSVESR
jgi:hypothetical protein